MTTEIATLIQGEDVNELKENLCTVQSWDEPSIMDRRER
jgi:hypothetical protein